MPGGLKILHLLSDDCPWEAAIQVASLAAAQRTLGLQPGIAALAGSRLAEYAGAADSTLFPLWIGKTLNPLHWLKLSRLLRDFAPDAAHTHDPKASGMLARASLLGKKIRVVHSRSRLDRASAGGSDKSAFLTAGVDLAAAAREAAARDKLREELQEKHCPTKQKPLFLVNIDPLEKDSRQAEILEAMTNALAALPQAHLFIMGEGNLEAELGSLTRESALDADITFLKPAFPGCFRLLAAADLYISARRDDEAGFMAMAALAAGRAAALSPSGCHPQLADDGKYAVLADSARGGIATAILELLENRARRERLGRQAGEWASKRFDLADRARELADFYVSPK